MFSGLLTDAHQCPKRPDCNGLSTLLLVQGCSPDSTALNQSPCESPCSSPCTGAGGWDPFPREAGGRGMPLNEGPLFSATKPSILTRAGGRCSREFGSYRELLLHERSQYIPSSPGLPSSPGTRPMFSAWLYVTVQSWRNSKVKYSFAPGNFHRVVLVNSR